MTLIMFLPNSSLTLCCYLQESKNARSAIEEPGATTTPKAFDLVLTTSAQAQEARAVLPERNPSWLHALIQEMQGFCDLWEEDLEKTKQSDSDNAKLQ